MNLLSNLDIVNIDKITDDFYKFYQKTTKHKLYFKNRDNNEIEINFTNPHLYLFSIFYNYKKSIKNSYIELVIIIKSNKKKLRLRKQINDYTKYINNKINIINDVTDEIWIDKEIIETELNDICFMKYSVEKKSDQTITKDHINIIKIYFVNSIKIQNSYFTSEIRLKTLLQSSNNENNNFILSYFNQNNFNRYLSLEIELHKYIIDLNEIEFKNEFKNIISFSFGIHKNNDINFIKNTNRFENPLKTIMITLPDILDIDYKNIIIMDKIDGEYIQFVVIKSYCYIIRYNLFIKLKTNIDPTYEFSGHGELVYIHGIRYIYPFYIKNIKKDNKKLNIVNRKENISYIQNMIIDVNINSNYEPKIQLNSKLEYGVIFKKKNIYGPYETFDQFLNSIIICNEKKKDYPTDGVILSNLLNNKNIEDYKLKDQNTIDIYSCLTLYDENILINDYLSFYLYTHDQNESLKIIYKKKILTSSDVYYDNYLSMLIFNVKDKLLVIPVNFIGEYNIDTQSLIPRIDKSNNLIYKKYKGNSYPVVNLCIIIHKYQLFINNEILKNLLEEEKINKIKKLLLELKHKIVNYLKQKPVTDIKEDEEKNTYITQPLNHNINWYKSNSESTRSPLNLLTNLNKTYALSLGIGPFVNNTTLYKSVISIYSGKGGDMMKFVYNNINKVVAIDPDQNALKEYETRRNNYSQNKTRIFNLKTILLRLEDMYFLDKLRKEIGINLCHDIIDIQLGLHFSLTQKTENHIINIFKSLVNVKGEINTRIFISVNDGDNIQKLFKKYNVENEQILNLKIDNNNNFSIKNLDTKIGVLYEQSMSTMMEEYLIYKADLINLFEKNNFTLLQTWCFHEIVQDKEIYKMMKNDYQRDSTFRFLKNLSEINFENNNLLEILSTYRYYIFEYEINNFF